MSSPISRRNVLVAPLALAGCATASPYFGRIMPPASQRIVHANGEEPSSLDPAQLVGSNSDVIVTALLESLTTLDPLTLQPAAALATAYDVDSRGTRYTFFLRGCPTPRGIRLRNTDALSPEFSAGRRAPLDRAPAVWSDGTPVTAHDFVYSWRRFVDPATAAPMAFYLTPLGNAEEIAKGAKPPNALAVHALDEFTLQFELVAPAPSFLKLLWQPFLAAVPRQAIEAARKRGRESSWTEPGHYVSSGPFLLREWKTYDRIVLTKNQRYWEARSVAIEEIVFLPISNGTANVNLYRAGSMQSMNPRLIPPVFVPALASKKDFATAPAWRTVWYSLNVTKSPLDRLLVRYALNLATDKLAIAKFLGAGQKPANGVVPPMPGYPSLGTLLVSIGGRELDISRFDPNKARELLGAEGISDLELSIIIPTRNKSKEIAEIVQRQWREHLRVRLNPSFQEETVWEQDLIHKRYKQVIEDSWSALCEDPNDFLVQFGPSHYAGTTWINTTYDRDFFRANGVLDPRERMTELAACEVQLIKAMPVIPLFHDTWAYLEAPYLRGLKPNPFGAPLFKYAWIDTNWRPQ